MRSLLAIRNAALAVVCVLFLGASARSADLTTFRVSGCTTCDDFKSVHYGVQSGIFRKYGLNVEIFPSSNGTAALAALVGGSVQAVNASAVAVLQAYVRGIPLRIVAPGQWYLSEAPTTALFVKSDSPIHSGRDLDGKTISVLSLNDLTFAATEAWIAKTGGDISTMKVIELPFPTVLPALEEGRIQAGSVGSPFMQQATASGQARMVAATYDAIAPRFEAVMWVSTVDQIAANRDVMSRFARAMHDIVLFTNDPAHRAEMNALVASYTHVDPDVVAASPRAVDPEYLEARFLQPVIDVAYRYKLIDRELRPEDLFSSVLLRPPSRGR